jgi:hypothetical protein
MWSGDIPEFQHNGRTYYVTVRKSPRGGSVYSWDIDTDPGDGADTPEYGTPEWDAYLAEEEAVRDAAREYVESLSHKLKTAFYAEDDYMSSDEQVSDACEANGYEFTEDGELYA